MQVVDDGLDQRLQRGNGEGDLQIPRDHISQRPGSYGADDSISNRLERAAKMRFPEICRIVPRCCPSAAHAR